MRKVLTIGAAICCIIGLITSADVISVIVTHLGWSDLLHYLRYPDAYVFSLYASLSFIPMILLFRSKRLENLKFRFVLIGIIEIIVICLFLAVLLFPPKI
jgi:hypothetical protein